jgi:hypothetical protein
MRRTGRTTTYRTYLGEAGQPRGANDGDQKNRRWRSELSDVFCGDMDGIRWTGLLVLHPNMHSLIFQPPWTPSQAQ